MYKLNIAGGFMLAVAGAVIMPERPFLGLALVVAGGLATLIAQL